jgi:hypothetical protein
MHTRIETITPEKAQEYLGKNTHNRKLRQKHVESLANEIRNGNWVVTHQGIAFSDTGELIDGQHRLAACILAKKEIEIMVSRHVSANGKPFTAQDIIDRGSIRSVGDQLALTKGLANANMATAACRWIITMALNHWGQTASIGNIQTLLELYGEQIQAVHSRICHTNIFRKSWIVGSLAFAARVHPDEVYEMARKLGDGDDMKTGDPILTLRNWLIDIGGSIRNKDRVSKEQFFNAIYHSLTGGTIKKVYVGAKGFDYFTSRQEKEIRKIRAMFGIQKDFAVTSVLKKNAKKNLS